MNSHQIEKAAADWLAKRDGENWTEVDEAGFAAWLGQSLAHRVEVVRLRAIWRHADRLQALGAGVPTGSVPPAGQWHGSSFPETRNDLLGAAVPASGHEAMADDSVEGPFLIRGERTRIFAVAAGLLAVVALGILRGGLEGETNSFRTGIGGKEAVPLADGSQVTLNTDSRIRVALSQSERRIDLDRGEAFFEVAKDPARPFVVRAADRRIVAVGTKFSVLRSARDVRVVVTEGEVRIERIAHGLADAAVTHLAAGDIARAGDAGVMILGRPVAEAEQYVAWRSGYLTFRATPLREAVAEFNRYNTRKLVIADPAIAELRIGGNLRPTNLSAFVRVLEQGFPIRATERDDEIVLSAR